MRSVGADRLALGALLLSGCARSQAPDGPSRCALDGRRLECSYETDIFDIAGEEREVHWQTPLGDPPAAGWPVAFVFQGSVFSATHNWAARPLTPFGGWHQVRLTQELLDGGYMVLTPEARGDGLTCWDTNRPIWADQWDASPDAALMDALFAAVDAGDFGPADPDRWVAAGISSGGYMTSRLAVTWPTRFAAVAIASASYATCVGALCNVPEDLPEDHPPTLFLQGLRDKVVPVWTPLLYERKLAGLGVEADHHIGVLAGHEWLSDAPELVLDWFEG